MGKKRRVARGTKTRVVEGERNANRYVVMWISRRIKDKKERAKHKREAEDARRMHPRRGTHHGAPVVVAAVAAVGM